MLWVVRTEWLLDLVRIIRGRCVPGEPFKALVISLENDDEDWYEALLWRTRKQTGR